MVRAFEACTTEVVHPSIFAKKDQLCMWMGSYLTPGKSSHSKGTYLKPEGTSSTLYLARVKANLVEISSGPLNEKHMISLTDKDIEVAETSVMESLVLQSPVMADEPSDGSE